MGTTETPRKPNLIDALAKDKRVTALGCFCLFLAVSVGGFLLLAVLHQHYFGDKPPTQAGPVQPAATAPASEPAPPPMVIGGPAIIVNPGTGTDPNCPDGDASGLPRDSSKILKEVDRASESLQRQVPSGGSRQGN
jgi:hypothetical protein